MGKHKCIAYLSCEERAALCGSEAKYPKAKDEIKYSGLSDEVTKKYCKKHWEQLEKNNGTFICIGVETAENGDCQYIDAAGTGRKLIIKGDIQSDGVNKVCSPRATSSRSVRGGTVYGGSLMSSRSPRLAVMSPRSPGTRIGSVVLSPMTTNTAGSPVRGGSLRSGTMTVKSAGTPASSIKTYKKKDEDSDSDASSVSTDSSSDSDSSDSDSSCGDSLSETSSISSCEDDDAIKNRRKSKKRKTKLKTSGISKRKRKALMKRNIRPAPPFTREKNPPIINIKYELAKKLVVIDSTYNITEAMDNMASFINIIHSQNAEDEHNKDYSYVVTEDVVDKVAKLLRKFMYNPLRIEMILSFLFNYETRDSSTTFDFYGFKKPAAETAKLISSYKDIYQKSPVSYQMELSFEGIRDRIVSLKMEYEGTGPKYNNGSISDREIKNLFLRLNNPTNRDDVFMEYEKVNDKYTIFKAEFAKTKNAGTAEAATTAKYSTGERPVDAGAAAAAAMLKLDGGPNPTVGGAAAKLLEDLQGKTADAAKGTPAPAPASYKDFDEMLNTVINNTTNAEEKTLLGKLRSADAKLKPQIFNWLKEIDFNRASVVLKNLALLLALKSNSAISNKSEFEDMFKKILAYSKNDVETVPGRNGKPSFKRYKNYGADINQLIAKINAIKTLTGKAYDNVNFEDIKTFTN